MISKHLRQLRLYNFFLLFFYQNVPRSSTDRHINEMKSLVLEGQICMKKEKAKHSIEIDKVEKKDNKKTREISASFNYFLVF